MDHRWSASLSSDRGVPQLLSKLAVIHPIFSLLSVAPNYRFGRISFHLGPAQLQQLAFRRCAEDPGDHVYRPLYSPTPH